MGYTINLEDIIKNLTVEEIRLLDYLNIQNTGKIIEGVVGLMGV